MEQAIDAREARKAHAPHSAAHRRHWPAAHLDFGRRSSPLSTAPFQSQGSKKFTEVPPQSRPNRSHRDGYGRDSHPADAEPVPGPRAHHYQPPPPPRALPSPSFRNKSGRVPNPACPGATPPARYGAGGRAPDAPRSSASGHGDVGPGEAAHDEGGGRGAGAVWPRKTSVKSQQLHNMTRSNNAQASAALEDERRIGGAIGGERATVDGDAEPGGRSGSGGEGAASARAPGARPPPPPFEAEAQPHRRGFVPCMHDTNLHKQPLGAMERSPLQFGVSVHCLRDPRDLWRGYKEGHEEEYAHKLVQKVVATIKQREKEQVLLERYMKGFPGISLEEAIAESLGPELQQVEEIDSSMQVALVKAMDQVGGSKLAMAAFHWMTATYGTHTTHQSTQVFDELIMACRRSFELNQAMAVFRIVQRTELPLDVFTYNLAIDVCKEKCLQHHNTKACAEAYQLYDDMLERRVRPNSYTFILLVTACRCKPSTHWRQATRAMTDMHEAGVCPERDFVIDSEYVKVCLSAMSQLNLDEALEVYEALAINGLNNNLEVFKAVLKACVRHNYPVPPMVYSMKVVQTWTSAVMRRRKQNAVSAASNEEDAPVHNSADNHQAGDVEDSKLRADPAEHSSKREDWGRVVGLQVFDWMAEGGVVVPDTEAFNLLLEACANTNSTYDALRVFGWMLLGKGFVEDIHVPNGITFNLVIKLCQKAGLLPDSSGVTPEFSRLDVGRRSNGMLEMDTLLDDKDEGPRNPVADDAPPTCVAEAGPSSVSLVDAPCISKLTDELRRISRINPNWYNEQPGLLDTKTKQMSQLHYLGLGRPNVQPTDQIDLADIEFWKTHERSINHLGQHVQLPPKLAPGTGWDNLGPGSWGVTLNIPKESIMGAMDLATRWHKLPDYCLDPSIDLAIQHNVQSAEDVPDSIEHWALKVLLLVLGMLVPGPETNLTPMHWGSYCNHKFGYTTVAEAKVDLQRSTKRESEERAFMDAAAKSQTHVKLMQIIANQRARESKIKDVLELEAKASAKWMRKKSGRLKQNGSKRSMQTTSMRRLHSPEESAYGTEAGSRPTTPMQTTCTSLETLDLENVADAGLDTTKAASKARVKFHEDNVLHVGEDDVNAPAYADGGSVISDDDYKNDLDQ